ncbi:hypothetical protein DBR32_12965 [Taibaiella sp. KBW10]|nr:hypothetical protein DBR32_12965 [Taibaiella sp. KBW10]
MTLMSFWYGISGDEVDMNNYGKAILEYYTSFGAERNALGMPKNLDRDGVLHFYGGFFDLLAVLVNKVSPFETYTTRHILNAWVGVLGIWYTGKICIRFSGYRTATLAAWLMFLAPFFLGHAMNNPKDIPFATAYIAGIYYFIRFYDRLPGVKWKDYIAPVMALAIAIDIRVAGILLIPFMGVYYVLNQVFHPAGRKGLKQVVLPLMAIAVCGYFGASLLWPYALQNPLLHPLKALSELSNFKVSIDQMYNGHRIPSPELPASYLLKNFIITNTYILLAGILLFFALMPFRKRNRYTAGVLFLIFVTFFPLFYIIYKHSNVYHAWRHVLFIFPGAAALSALGLGYLMDLIKAKKVRVFVSMLIIAGFLEPAYFIIKTFPDTITYYNGMVGGTKAAYYNYEMDYYYNSVREAADWFIKNELPKIPKTDTVIVGSNAEHILSVYFKDYPNLSVEYVRFHERSMRKWDYGIFHRALIREKVLQSQSWMIDGKLYAATIEGLPLCVVFKRVSYKDIQAFELVRQGKAEQAYPYFQEYRNIDPMNEIVDTVLSSFYTPAGQPQKELRLYGKGQQ